MKLRIFALLFLFFLILFFAFLHKETHEVTSPTELWTAVCKERLKVVEALLRAGADPDEKSLGSPPLYEAIIQENIDIARLLLSYGANVNARNTAIRTQGEASNKWTPLHYAVYQENKEMVRLLIDYNADINIKDRWGKKPIYYARKNRNIEIEELLSEGRKTTPSQPQPKEDDTTSPTSDAEAMRVKRLRSTGAGTADAEALASPGEKADPTSSRL